MKILDQGLTEIPWIYKTELKAFNWRIEGRISIQSLRTQKKDLEVELTQ